MLEFGQILGFFSAAVLALAVAAWVRLGSRPAWLSVRGRSGDDQVRGAERASRVLVLALGLSILAAISSVIGWIGL